MDDLQQTEKELSNENLPLDGSQELEISEDTDAIDKFFEIYNQIEESNDIAEMTAEFMTFSEYYNYALTISNALNGRQGRKRITITHETSRLMDYSQTVDIDTYLENQSIKAAQYIFNEYLSDKQILPSNQPRKALSLSIRAKALFIQLFYSGNYGLVDLLKVPDYCKDAVNSVFDVIESIKEETTDNFIKFLENGDNWAMAEIVRELGTEFWGSENTDAQPTYMSRFVNILSTIKNPKETYDGYLQFRNVYLKSRRNTLPSIIYDKFDMTADSYSKARVKVFKELDELYSDENSKKIIKSILYDD